MATKIVFLDIDGTLINSYQGSNVQDAGSIFANLQRQNDLLLAINSNRSLQDIEPIATEFKIRGPLVAENGAFFYLPHTKEITRLISPNTADKITKNLGYVKKLIQEFVTEKSKLKLIYKDTDTVKELKHLDKYLNINDALLILNNKFRQYTLSIHVRVVKNNHIKPAVREIKFITTFVQKSLPKNLNLTVTFSKKYSNLLVFSNRISKQTAVAQ